MSCDINTHYALLDATFQCILLHFESDVCGKIWLWGGHRRIAACWLIISDNRTMINRKTTVLAVICH
jgi:hypothetical protein